MNRLLTTLVLLAPLTNALPRPQDPTPSSTSAAAAPSATGSTPETCADRVRQFAAWSLTSFSHQAASSISDPDAEPVTSSSLSFSVHNPVLDYDVECAVEIDATFDGLEQFSCEPPEGEVQGGGVVFKYDALSGMIELEQRWICRDNPEFPSIYTGIGSGIANPECSETGTDPEEIAAGALPRRVVDCVEGTVEIPLEEIHAVAR